MQGRGGYEGNGIARMNGQNQNYNSLSQTLDYEASSSPMFLIQAPIAVMHICIAFLRAPKAMALKPHKRPAKFLIPITRGARKGNTREAISYDIEYQNPCR